MPHENRKKLWPRLGLCCIFLNEPIKFKHLRAITLSGLTKKTQLSKISSACLHNAECLALALETVHRLDIGAFRILSQIFPIYTHPKCGYTLDDLHDRQEILSCLQKAGDTAARHDIRLSFHPDQFVVLASPDEKVVKNSIAELEYHAFVAEIVGAEIINIHVGGVYGDKRSALDRLARNLDRLSPAARRLITMENDDRSYSPADLLEFCENNNLPMVYDVHHHRCNPDSLSIEEATMRTIQIWKKLGREPYFHISSPKNGWSDGADPLPHADYIDFKDFPACWLGIRGTIDVEAKAKELAIARLSEQLKNAKTKQKQQSVNIKNGSFGVFMDRPLSCPE